MRYVYGPVPSRRLGFSLGVDIVPYKTYSLDCIYCQLGKTTRKSVERKLFTRKENVLGEVKEVLNKELYNLLRLWGADPEFRYRYFNKRYKKEVHFHISCYKQRHF